MGYTVEAKAFLIPVRMKSAALDLFDYLASAPDSLQIKEFGVFGSVARQESRITSDLDVLIVSSGNLRDVRYFCTHERCSDRTDIGVDIVITNDSFSTGSELFKKKVMQDYIPIWRCDT